VRTSEFLDPPTRPVIAFRSTRIERRGDTARIHGTLTMRGVARPAVLEGAFVGTTRTAHGKLRVGCSAATTIDSMDFGVAWNRAAEGGGLTLGDGVTTELAVATVEP
jgi:polyisoprenoid-binding protein YceI